MGKFLKRRRGAFKLEGPQIVVIVVAVVVIAAVGWYVFGREPGASAAGPLRTDPEVQNRASTPDAPGRAPGSSNDPEIQQRSAPRGD